MEQARKLRSSGKLLEFGKKIKCPATTLGSRDSQKIDFIISLRVK